MAGHRQPGALLRRLPATGVLICVVALVAATLAPVQATADPIGEIGAEMQPPPPEPPGPVYATVGDPDQPFNDMGVELDGHSHDRSSTDPDTGLVEDGSSRMAQAVSGNDVVSVIASDPFATEAESTGTFVIWRTGDASAALTVDYAASGTATEGTDYDSLSGQVVFAIGETSVPVVINPLDDGTADGTETVTLTVTPSVDHDIDLGAATLNIRDKFDGAGVDAIVPLDETFQLSSLPGARHTIYLDVFGGNYHTSWPDPDDLYAVYIAPYDTNGDESTLSDAEKAQIQAIWKGAAEDYLPFSINVTTAEPDIEALRKTSETDLEWGGTVLIGKDPGNGFAWSGGLFDRPDDYPSYVSYKNIYDGYVYPPALIAAGVSHEAGHTMGLFHDNLGGYYSGHAAGSDWWTPIMGLTVANLTQWATDSFPGADNPEDDLAIIANSTNGFGYKPDDHSDQATYATPLTTLDDGGGTMRGEGIIEQGTDVDWFTFDSSGGDVVINITPADRSANLDIGADLYDSSLQLVANGDQIDSLAAAVSTTLTAGTYHLKIDGVGNRTWSDGYDDYGSLGEYAVTIGAGALAAFDPTSGPSASTPIAGTTQYSQVTVGDLTGVSVGSASFSDTWALYWNAPATLDPNEYIGFTVSSPAGTELAFGSLEASLYSFATSASNVALRSSLDGFTSDIGGVQTLGANSHTVVSFDLSGVTASSNSVEFRLYIYSSTGSSLPSYRYLTATSYPYDDLGQGLSLTGQVIDSRPSLTSAATSVDGDAIILTFDETLSSTTASPSDFTVTADAASVSVTGVATSGSSVSLTLGSAVSHGQNVQVTYDDPTTGDDAQAIQATDGRDAGSFSAVGVTNNVPAPPATEPGAPTIANITPTHNSLTVDLTPPADDGGDTIVLYSVDCDGNTASDAQTTVVVTGLASETTYSCAATATNSVGPSPPSASVQATTSATDTGDTVAPVVTAPSSISVAAVDASGTPATNAAVAAFLNGATATDDVDGSRPVTNNAPNVLPLGTTTVTFTATDTAGNTGTATAPITVADQTNPTISAPSPISVPAVDVKGATASHDPIAAFLAAASATDNVDGTISVTSNSPSQFPIGPTTVTFTATDTAGNTASGTSTVTVEHTPATLFPTDCPQVTDSVYRLYSAYFLRDPDTQGWEYWQSVYLDSNADLETISWSFAASQEFQTRYGSLNNRAFVKLVYRNVLQREPELEGLNHWTGALDAGYGRGAVMLAFSESREYVRRTATKPPMAGYLMWYHGTVEAVCGTGDGVARIDGANYVDIMVTNDNRTTPGSYQVSFAGGLQRDPIRYQIPADSYDLRHNQEIGDTNPGWLIIETGDNPDLTWTIVFYPHPHSSDRSPWTDSAQAALTTRYPRIVSSHTWVSVR